MTPRTTDRLAVALCGVVVVWLLAFCWLLVLRAQRLGDLHTAEAVAAAGILAGLAACWCMAMAVLWRDA